MPEEPTAGEPNDSGRNGGQLGTEELPPHLKSGTENDASARLPKRTVSRSEALEDGDDDEDSFFEHAAAIADASKARDGE